MQIDIYMLFRSIINTRERETQLNYTLSECFHWNKERMYKYYLSMTSNYYVTFMAILLFFRTYFKSYKFMWFLFLNSVSINEEIVKYVTWVKNIFVYVFTTFLYIEIKLFEVMFNDFFVQVKEPFVEKLSRQVSRFYLLRELP